MRMKGQIMLLNTMKTYKKPPNDPVTTREDIDNFLEETVNHQTVNNAKLTDAEKLSLESPLTLLEFEKSMSESNFASAPGLDGISNKFIRHIWSFLKIHY